MDPYSLFIYANETFRTKQLSLMYVCTVHTHDWLGFFYVRLKAEKAAVRGRMLNSRQPTISIFIFFSPSAAHE